MRPPWLAIRRPDRPIESLPEPSAFQLTRIPVKIQDQNILVAPSL